MAYVADLLALTYDQYAIRSGYTASKALALTSSKQNTYALPTK